MLRLAELYLDSGNLDGAVSIMQRMLALDPTSSELNQMTMTILLDAERYADATALLRTAESLVPTGDPLESFFVEALREVNDRMRESGRVSDSLVAYARELVLRSGAAAPVAIVRIHAGDVALRIGDSASAEALYARALSDTLASSQTWIHVARAFVEARDAATGLRVVAPSAERFADDYRVHRYVGMLFALAGARDSAIAYLRAALELNQDDADAWSELAQVLATARDYGASDEAFERAIAVDPENAATLHRFAHVLAERATNLDRALELVRIALEIEPENEAYLGTRGLIHFKRDELDAALEYLNRAIAAGGATATMYEYLGDVRAARGELEEARSSYAAALQIEPARVDIRRKLGALGMP
jgi:tetratricopeptide (TPR) repeat protein